MDTHRHIPRVLRLYREALNSEAELLSLFLDTADVECIRPTSKDPAIYAAACERYKDFCKDKVPDWGSKAVSAPRQTAATSLASTSATTRSSSRRMAPARAAEYIGKVEHYSTIRAWQHGGGADPRQLRNCRQGPRVRWCLSTLHWRGVKYAKARKGLYDDALVKQRTRCFC